MSYSQYLAHAFPGDGAINAHFGEEPLLNSQSLQGCSLEVEV